MWNHHQGTFKKHIASSSSVSIESLSNSYIEKNSCTFKVLLGNCQTFTDELEGTRDIHAHLNLVRQIMSSATCKHIQTCYKQHILPSSLMIPFIATSNRRNEDLAPSFVLTRRRQPCSQQYLHSYIARRAREDGIQDFLLGAPWSLLGQRNTVQEV